MVDTDIELMECDDCKEQVDADSLECPLCGYDFILCQSSKKFLKTKAKEAKIEKKTKEIEQKTHQVQQRTASSVRNVRIFTPALATSTRQVISIPEMKFRGDYNDENLLTWARCLRSAWENLPEPFQGHSGYLTNHAIRYIADWSEDKKFHEYAERIFQLLGGDDC